MTTPFVSQIVLVNNIFHNGVNTHPGILTRVWRYDEEQATGLVNVTVILDAGAPSYQTSVPFFPDEKTAQQFLANQGNYSAVKIVCYAKD